MISILENYYNTPIEQRALPEPIIRDVAEWIKWNPDFVAHPDEPWAGNAITDERISFKDARRVVEAVLDLSDSAAEEGPVRDRTTDQRIVNAMALLNVIKEEGNTQQPSSKSRGRSVSSKRGPHRVQPARVTKEELRREQREIARISKRLKKCLADLDSLRNEDSTKAQWDNHTEFEETQLGSHSISYEGRCFLEGSIESVTNALESLTRERLILKNRLAAKTDEVGGRDNLTKASRKLLAKVVDSLTTRGLDRSRVIDDLVALRLSCGLFKLRQSDQAFTIKQLRARIKGQAMKDYERIRKR